jgi:hypothetical protein
LSACVEATVFSLGFCPCLLSFRKFLLSCICSTCLGVVAWMTVVWVGVLVLFLRPSAAWSVGPTVSDLLDRGRDPITSTTVVGVTHACTTSVSLRQRARSAWPGEGVRVTAAVEYCSIVWFVARVCEETHCQCLCNTV